MLKNTVIALVAAATVAGAAVPAFADTEGLFHGSQEFQQFTADSIVARLQAQGVNATAVEEWSGLVRAYVTLEDGRQVMQLFTPGSLEPVAL
jgi:hypothetical protein